MKVGAPRALGGLAAVLVLGGGGEARANGAFPAAGQVIWDPAEPSRYLLKTNYGLVASADSGATWTWTCEAALDVFGGEFHPQLAKALEGVIFGGLPDGMVRGQADTCGYVSQTEMRRMRKKDRRRAATMQLLRIGISNQERPVEVGKASGGRWRSS